MQITTFDIDGDFHGEENQSMLKNSLKERTHTELWSIPNDDDLTMCNRRKKAVTQICLKSLKNNTIGRKSMDL